MLPNACPKPKPKTRKVSRGLRQHTRLKKINAKRGGHAFPRNVDEPYREWIRALPCRLANAPMWAPGAALPSARAVCPVGDWGVIDAAHVKSRGAGGKDRANLVPLCHWHHMEQHDLGIRTFQCRYGIDLKVIARQLTEVYEAEKF